MIRERKHIRLPGWDYSSDGIYFITICTRDMQFPFGEILNHKMILNEIGYISKQCWLEIPKHFPNIRLAEYVIMPNHIHGILIIDNSLVRPRHGVALQGPPIDAVGTCHGMSLHIQSHDSVLPRHGVALPIDMAQNNDISQENAATQNNDISQENAATQNNDISQTNYSTQTFSRVHNTNQFSKPIKNSISVIINQYKASVKRWCNKNGYVNFQWQPRFYDVIIHNEYSMNNTTEYINNNPENWTEDELNK